MDSVMYDDGRISYERITNNTVNGGLSLLRNSFFLEENVCKAVELQKNENAMAEMEMLAFDSTKDGVSLVAVDKNTKSVIGVLISKIHAKTNGKDNSGETPGIKEPSTLAIMQIVKDVDEDCNFCKRYETGSTMEMFLLSVAPDYRRRGIAKKLFELSFELCEGLNSGRKTLLSLDLEALPLAAPPKVIYGICTTITTQKLLDNLGFTPATKFDYDKLSFNGKTFAESADSSCAIVYYKVM